MRIKITISLIWTVIALFAFFFGRLARDYTAERHIEAQQAHINYLEILEAKMTHLFKLKKDGEPVGRLKIDHIEPTNLESGMAIWVRLVGEKEWDLYDWHKHNFNEALPFVCEDKK